MISKEETRKKIRKLVEEFLEYSKEEINKKSENQIKSEFIDPLFEALGWDMRRDAEREERVLKGRAEQDIKNVDYEIDEEVYKLYGIIDEEKKIIWKSLN